MAKRTKSASKKTKRSKTYSTVTSPEPTPKTRRDVMGIIRNGVIGLGLVGPVLYFAGRKVEASVAEQNLANINHSRPTIVQIHDPNCRLCRALQKQTRKALKSMGDERPDYFVANISTIEGQSFANKYGAQHVTLLMFDENGKLIKNLSGVRQREELLGVFKDYVDEF